MNTLSRLSTLVIVAGLATSGLSAQAILINNPSFEIGSGGYIGSGFTATSIPGWSENNGGGGIYGSSDDVSTLFSSGLSGTRAVYINGATLVQLTSATFETGRTYTLTVDLGNPSNSASFPNSRNGLFFGFRNAADTDYRSASYIDATAVSSLPLGSFQTFSLGYTALAGDNGNAIKIGLTDFFSSAYYRIDNVTLSVAPIPEPASFAALLGLASLGCVAAKRRRRA